MHRYRLFQTSHERMYRASWATLAINTNVAPRSFLIVGTKKRVSIPVSSKYPVSGRRRYSSPTFKATRGACFDAGVHGTVESTAPSAGILLLALFGLPLALWSYKVSPQYYRQSEATIVLKFVGISAILVPHDGTVSTEDHLHGLHPARSSE